MKTIAIVIIFVLVITMFIGLGIDNGSAGPRKVSEPSWGKTFTQYSPGGNLIMTCYAFPFLMGDNLTINVTAISGNSRVISFGTINNGQGCSAGSVGGPFLYFITSNETITNQQSITVSTQYWLVSGVEQSMGIWVQTDSTGSITYSINKINATQPQDPAIKDLQNQVNVLQTNMTNAQTQISILTQQLNTMNNTQKQMLINITNLWNAFDKLNTSLTDLTDIVNNLNTSSYQNYSKNITWLGDNITKIKADLYDIQNQITVLSKDKDNIKDVQGQLNNTLKNITTLNNNITQIKNTLPKAYNDTALKNQIAQLQKENAQLKANIDTLNKTKNEKIIEKKADNSVSYGAIALGIVALIVGIIAIITRTPKTPTKDDSDEASISKDYDEVEEKPKEIPKAKAKKSKDDDDEDLDDVMKKLEK